MKKQVQKGEITDLDMMRNPNNWPNLSLPLVHRKKIREDMQAGSGIGILWTPIGNLPKGSKRVYSFFEGQNMFCPVLKDAPFVTGGDELLVKLIEEGWEVD